MKIIIPMAGLGSRLRPHTFSRPKPLVNVAGQPMLKHLLDTVVELNAEEYIFIVGHLGEQIEEYVNTSYDINARFVVQDELVGQAHAIYLAREYLNGPAIVLFSDTLFETDLSIIKTTEADAVAFVKEVEDPRRFGVVELNDEGIITKFTEKPETMDNRNVVIGLYYIRDSKAMIRAIETQMDRNQMTKGEFYIADAFQIMIDEGAKFITQDVSVWLDCGKPETVLETNRYLLENGHDNSKDITQPGVTVIPPVFVHEDAVLENAVIGPYTVVGAGAEIRNSIIKDSIIDDGAHVYRMIMDGSLIGRDARVKGRFFTLNVGDTSSIDLT